jgi:hypothetical protein
MRPDVCLRERETDRERCGVGRAVANEGREGRRLFGMMKKLKRDGKER